MYERSSPLTSVNECLRKFFTKNRRALENIPPSEDALLQHLKRAMVQTFIWVSCLLRQVSDLDYAKWGWVVDEHGVHPSWQTLAEPAKACIELCKCSSKIRCNPKTWSCKKDHDMKCTQLCDVLTMEVATITVFNFNIFCRMNIQGVAKKTIPLFKMLVNHGKKR